MSEPLTREAIERSLRVLTQGGYTISAEVMRGLKAECETLRAQLEWCESERNAARARCEQLEIERGASADTIVKLMKRCEQLERELDLEKDRFADLLARTHDAESRCKQLEAGLREILERWPDIAAIRKIATAATENSTIASESTG